MMNFDALKGKRIHLSLTDENRLSIETKIDIGVHTRTDVETCECMAGCRTREGCGGYRVIHIVALGHTSGHGQLTFSRHA